MVKKNNLSRFLKFAALLLPIAIICQFSQSYLFCYVDDDTARIHDFYTEEKNSFDVVFIGASEVYTGYSPAYVYDHFGFTTYMYAVASNPGSLYKSQLKEVLSRQNPQLIFVEVNGFLGNDEELMDEAPFRMYVENIPLSYNKVDTIFRYEYENKASCLFPFLKYHGDWQKVEELVENYKFKTMEYDEPALLKGMFTVSAIDDAEAVYDVMNDNTAEDISEREEAYLIDFLEYCKTEKLDNIVFVRFPHKLFEANYNRYTHANRVGHIVEKYGYEYINLDQKVEEMKINYTNDFYNNEHLNIYGQIKLSEYLGNLIKNKYQITPIEQTKTNVAHWKECVKYTSAYFHYVDLQIKDGVYLWVFENPEYMTLFKKMVYCTGDVQNISIS